jgi:alpha-D-ribose 1-methylphosphonate 5-triphosphate synthase subunit PhnH
MQDASLQDTLPSNGCTLKLAAGLANPVFDSQACFRAVMGALAAPGHVFDPGTGLQPPAPLNPAAAAVMLTLNDFETTIWLSPSIAQHGEVAEYLLFHTGATVAPSPSAAAFALIDLRQDEFDPAQFAQGTPEYPDRSTTVIALCDALHGEASMGIAGPGIDGSSAVSFNPMPPDFPAMWQANRSGFPLGVDLVLTAGQQLMALPRSTRILAEAA